MDAFTAVAVDESPADVVRVRTETIDRVDGRHARHFFLVAWFLGLRIERGQAARYQSATGSAQKIAARVIGGGHRKQLRGGRIKAGLVGLGYRAMKPRIRQRSVILPW